MEQKFKSLDEQIGFVRGICVTCDNVHGCERSAKLVKSYTDNSTYWNNVYFERNAFGKVVCNYQNKPLPAEHYPCNK
jgi:hypothetical protein